MAITTTKGQMKLLSHLDKKGFCFFIICERRSTGTNPLSSALIELRIEKDGFEDGFMTIKTTNGEVGITTALIEDFQKSY